eukprot:1046815-Prorocentrum_minimum.AAC.5
MAVLEANGVSADVSADGKIPGNGKANSKSQKRREKKKAVKAARKNAPPDENQERGVDAVESSGDDKGALDGIEIEYVQKLEIEEEDNPLYEDFKNIFQKFALGEEGAEGAEGAEGEGADEDASGKEKKEEDGEKDDSDSDSDKELDEEVEHKYSCGHQPTTETPNLRPFPTDIYDNSL